MKLDQSLNIRIRNMISLAWEIFSKKVGNELISVNKEASMQLQYAYILQQLMPLIIINKKETVELELEKTINDGITNREVDIFLIANDEEEETKIAIELKCYRKIASSGNSRGATDVFMKDVYEDLQKLERYCGVKSADVGIALIMNDHPNIIYPKNKKAKCWDYDISEGAKIDSGIILDTPIGGKEININLEKSYQFNWDKVGGFWFAEIEGNTKVIEKEILEKSNM